MAAKKQVTSASWSKDPINYFSITSLDGRNYHKISQLSNYFSEFSINKSRVWVEIEYLIFLAEIGIVPKLKTDEIGNLRSFYKNFSEKDMIEIKKIETQTNHDVKAVEYYIKDRLKKTGLLSHVEMVHWALTSEDVNNIAINSNLQAYILKEQLPIISKVIGSLVALIKKSDQLMLARTHGQPAGVTLLSKELSFYLDRILEEYLVLKNLKIKGKVSGVVGTFADQNFSYPSKKWIDLSGKFIERLGLAPSIVNTQILPYDSMISVFNSITRLQNISLDLVKNLWHYVSLGYFVQAKKEGEVGSSILPHKVNPIYLEGAEGGFELSSAIFEFYGRKLSQSRMQRDLSDSTIRRSMGVAFGYSYLSWQSVVEAVERIHPDQKTMFEELKNHWEIVTGPVQNLLRKKKYARPYEMFSEKVRGKTLTQKQFVSLIDSLDIKHQDKTYLKNVSLNDLVGESENIVNYTLKKAEKVLKDKNSIVVVGLQWGDEGKGKFIDYLGSDFPITVRYNGGNNAGHTVKSGKKVFHFSLIPSSVFHKKEAYISQAVVIDPKILIDEINQLKKLGIKPKLGIDFRCHIVLPYHGALDSASEWYKKGEKTGSLKLGIGFTYEDRTNRAGLRMEDLVDPERVRTVVNRNWDLKKKRVTKAYGTTFPLKKEEVIKDYTKFGKILSPYVADVTKIISEKIKSQPIVFESAQGTYLDFVFGSYPYTVAYHTISSAVLTNVGLPPQYLEVLGIIKAYTTRVGNGPFGAEIYDKDGDYIREKGHEYGTVSKRPRRCGWLDIPMIKQAILLNGVTELAVTKLDVLSGLPEIKVVDYYVDTKGNRTDLPRSEADSKNCIPHFAKFEGWKQNIDTVKKYEALPKNCREYLEYIKNTLGIPITYVSLGPDRNQTIETRNKF